MLILCLLFRNFELVNVLSVVLSCCDQRCDVGREGGCAALRRKIALAPAHNHCCMRNQHFRIMIIR